MIKGYDDKIIKSEEIRLWVKIKMRDDKDCKLIGTLSELEKLAKRLERETIIAVDLEADSMYHFQERVCLVQIATRRECVVIDPLEVRDLSALRPVFVRPDIQKIFHGSDYDVRSLNRDFDIEINALFDTQLACRFLGEPETGLEAVIQKYFDVALDKKYQKKDWSERPLPDDMLEYAANDVMYLIPLAEILQRELEDKNRLSWVEEECLYLSRVRSSVSDDEPLFLKFKGAGRLRPRSLAILESLLQFRLELARKKDRPPFKIFTGESLLQLIKIRPLTMERLKQVETLSRRQINMYGEDIIAAVKQAMEISEPELPTYPRKKAPILSPKVPKRVKVLKSWRDEVSTSLGIDPALICNKSLLSAIAIRNPRNKEELDTIEDMKQWQKIAFGRDILAALKGVK